MKKLLIIFCLLLSSLGLSAQMNNPYADDKLFHYGFSLGMNFMGYHVSDSTASNQIMMPGFSVGFIANLRLCRHLDLRCLPTLNFGYKVLKFNVPIAGDSEIDIISLPLALPLVLKWSAEREKNYRPYLVGGGGVKFETFRSKTQPIYPNWIDYFATFGVGCDFYMPLFKLCPELTYQIGFANVLNSNVRPDDTKYVDALAGKRMLNHQLTLTFNFE